MWEGSRAALEAQAELNRFRLADHAEGWGRAAEVDGCPVGFAAVLPGPPDVVELDGLLVEPPRQAAPPMPPYSAPPWTRSPSSCSSSASCCWCSAPRC